MGECSWITFQRGAKVTCTFAFSHIGLCALVIGYSIAGGFLFTWLEKRAVLEPFNSTDHIERLIDEMQNISDKNNGSLSMYRNELFEKMRNFSSRVAKASREERYDKTAKDLEERWSIINSLFYCVTVITTIGYGHLFPRTTYGRLVTIVYSLIGIPIMLLYLKNIGDSMATTFRFAYRRICCSPRKQQHEGTFPDFPSRNNNHSRKSSRNMSRPPPSKVIPTYQSSCRKNMLISPPISTTIHRGSDQPFKSIYITDQLPTSNRQPESSLSCPLTSPMELTVESILEECAMYTESINSGSPRLSVTPQDGKMSPTRKLTPLLAHPDLLSNGNDKLILSVPGSGYEIQSTPSSPGQNSTVSLVSSGGSWGTHDGNGADTEGVYTKPSHPKSTPGKTLVVYNTLSGEALKQQTKLQRKMALERAKRGYSCNEATTVFTDPITGQPVDGDLLGLNYRPIQLEPSDRDTRVPISIVLAFVFGYLVLGAILFSYLEAWYLSDSFYFCFITLSTIGFGDLVPGNLGYETRDGQIKLVALALYLMLGLAVLAMSFNLVQEEVVLKCKAFAQYIGLKDE